MTSQCEVSKEDQLQVVESLWNKTEQILILLEPGTPKGFHFYPKSKRETNWVRSFFTSSLFT